MIWVVVSDFPISELIFNFLSFPPFFIDLKTYFSFFHLGLIFAQTREPALNLHPAPSSRFNHERIDSCFVAADLSNWQ